MLSKQQLKARMTGLGGSDVASALGLSPWKTQLQLWAEKVGKIELPEANEAMEWGSRLETPIMSKFEQNHPEMKVSHGGGTVRDNRHNYLLATPDAFILDGKNKPGILEIKTSSQNPWDTIPTYYELQARHYCYVLERDYAYFAVLFRGSQYREYGPFFFNAEEYENDVIPLLKDFWQAVKDKRPIFEPIDFSELEHIITLDPDLEPMEVTDETSVLINKIKAASDGIKSSEENVKKWKLELAEMMGAHMKIVDADGRTLVTQSQIKDSVIVDSKRLKEEQPFIFDKYSKTRKGWRTMRVW